MSPEEMINKVFYLYNPLETTIYSLLVTEVNLNLFKEPDEIYCKSKVYANETGIKDDSNDWSNAKTNTIVSFLSGDLKSQKEAENSLLRDLALTSTRLEKEMEGVSDAIKDITLARLQRVS